MVSRPLRWMRIDILDCFLQMKTIIILQDQETWDLLDECSIIEVSDEDYQKWEAKGTEDIGDFKPLDPPSFDGRRVTVNRARYAPDE